MIFRSCMIYGSHWVEITIFFTFHGRRFLHALSDSSPHVFEKNRRICNYIRIKQLFVLFKNWVMR